MGSNIGSWAGRSTGTMGYDVDLVFCIDATMSMDHILDTVKQNALNFYSDLVKCMEDKKKHITQLRVRIIAFRDYFYDREKAMLVTDFFPLPDQAESFRACVGSIVADGGGDDPEDGLEALAYAMKSKWTPARPGVKRRQVIVVWSDDGTHDLGFGRSAPNYPHGMPADFNELTRWWGTNQNPGEMDAKAKRLVLFTPDKPSWSKISDNWNQVIHYAAEAGKGLENVGYAQILTTIAQSI
ncbi:MAG: hypothetical protein LIO51_05700 [Clostridiales bacterium]|nr:hypothetical protein [Clostridiales bacterium]